MYIILLIILYIIHLLYNHIKLLIVIIIIIMCAELHSTAATIYTTLTMYQGDDTHNSRANKSQHFQIEYYTHIHTSILSMNESVHSTCVL